MGRNPKCRRSVILCTADQLIARPTSLDQKNINTISYYIILSMAPPCIFLILQSTCSFAAPNCLGLDGTVDSLSANDLAVDPSLDNDAPWNKVELEHNQNTRAEAWKSWIHTNPYKSDDELLQIQTLQFHLPIQSAHNPFDAVMLHNHLTNDEPIGIFWTIPCSSARSCQILCRSEPKPTSSHFFASATISLYISARHSCAARLVTKCHKIVGELRAPLSKLSSRSQKLLWPQL